MTNRSRRQRGAYPEPDLLDLSAFTTREECLRLAGEGCPAGYTKVAREALDSSGLTSGLMLLMAMVSRARGLHEAIIRELERDNPHAVLPLTRAWVELVTIALYCLKKPNYIAVLLNGHRDSNVGGRKSFEAMFNAVREDASGLKNIYGELSEYTHFGPLAIYNVHRVGSEVDRTITWTDAPHWRNDTHFKVACAQAAELAEVALVVLPRLAALVRSEEPIGTFDPPPRPGLEQVQDEGAEGHQG